MANVHHSRRFTMPGYKHGARNETMEDRAQKVAAQADAKGRSSFVYDGELYLKCGGKWLKWFLADPTALEPTGQPHLNRGAETRGRMSVERGRGRRRKTAPSPRRSKALQSA